MRHFIGQAISPYTRPTDVQEATHIVAFLRGLQPRAKPSSSTEKPTESAKDKKWKSQLASDEASWRATLSSPYFDEADKQRAHEALAYIAQQREIDFPSPAN